ncbi:radical SAM protein [Candidatus Woesearchaeota archaeon]|nr:radical SAM protein [Candidatus Woesearchaeota archaeon]
MITNVRKIVKQKDQNLVFNSNGRLVKLTGEEYDVFDKFGTEKSFPKDINPNEKKILEELCDLELIDFPDYSPKEVKKKFSDQLYRSNSSEPLQRAPFLAHLAVTTACNMHCKYCSVRKAHQRKEIKELTTEQWKTIIKKLGDYGVFQIGFTGGEPTLRKDIHELMRFTESIGCVCNLTTNGWFLSEDFVKEMAKTEIKQCQISVDSFNEDIHDRLRGKGSLNRAIKAIKLLQKYQIHVGIDCVVSKNNIKDVLNLINRCEEMKIEYVTLIKLKKGDLDDEKFQILVPTYDDYGKIIDSLCFRKNEMPNVTIDCASISNLQFTLRDNELQSIPTAGCPIGYNLICIAPNGDIYPCAALMDKKFKLGNILVDNFSELWKDHQLLRNFRDIKNQVEGKCKACKRLDFCRGGCRGIAHTLNHKSLYTSDNSCNYIGGI